MGIRFNRDSVKPTNGPMIFFSDPSAEISLGEEIRGALSSCLSFYAYRCPGDTMISFGSSEGVSKGIGQPGFVIAPFDNSAVAYTIPYRPSNDMIKSAASGCIVPNHSTSIEEHAREVELIKHILNETGHGKIVAARVIVEYGVIDPAATFSQLCLSCPDAFVFLFSTPLTGCWLGASPELLLEGTDSGIRTMALAGTRPAGSTGDWDEKNIDEQRMVVEYITECLSRNGMTLDSGPTMSKQAGYVEHICTPIKVTQVGNLDPKTLSRLLKDLSPTPALCGLPKDLAAKVISDIEAFPRAYYGGFCGPFKSVRDFSFYVNLRCCQFCENRYALYVGGGITSASVSPQEWEETEMKADTLRRNLIL